MEKKLKYKTLITIKREILKIVLTGEVTEASVEKLWKQFFGLTGAINVKCLLVDIRTLKGRFGYIGKAIRHGGKHSLQTQMAQCFC